MALRALNRQVLVNKRAVLSTAATAHKIHPDWVNNNNDHPAFKKVDLTFRNAKEAFKSKSNFELARALLVYRLCSLPPLVEHQKEVLSLAEKVFPSVALEKALDLTFYGHFVAGPDIPSIKPVIDRYRRFGVKSILDYSVEKDVDAAAKKVEARSSDDEKICDENLQHFISCINAVAQTTAGAGFAAVKVTALGKPELLMRISEALDRSEDLFRKLTGEEKMTESQFKKGLSNLGISISPEDLKQWFSWLDTSKDGVIDIFEWSNLLNPDIPKILSLPSLKEYTNNLKLVPLLDPAITQSFRNLVSRLNEIVEHAKSKNVRVLIDAEQTYLQPVINRLTVEMMRKFNKEKALVFNTYQAYTRTALQRAKLDLALSASEDFYIGCKVVRGAYIEQERARAREMKYPDPIWANEAETTACYTAIFEEYMKQAKQRAKGKVSIMCATHNEGSVRHAIMKMKEMGISPDDEIVCFGQLMGMCDQVSFSLGQAGFSVYKYVPYGPTFEVMPYLTRRAQENSSIFHKVRKERELLKSELHRRLRDGQICYEPPRK